MKYRRNPLELLINKSNGILVSVAFLLIGVVLNYLVPAQVFTNVTSVATF